MKSPLQQIAENAGRDGHIVAEAVQEKTGSFGFDAATGKYVDMVEAGIIDPALVAHTALENAASVAGLMLTTNALVAELKDNVQPVQGAVS